MARVKISQLPNNRGLGWAGGNAIDRDGDDSIGINARLSCYEGLVVPDGRLMVPTIPTTDPNVPDRLWSNGGVLEVSQTKPSITTHAGAWFYSDGVTADGLRLEDCRTGLGTTRELVGGNALVLNGSNQYVAGPTATSPTTWSAACWVYPLAVGAYDAIFSNRTSGINWYIGTNDSNQLYVAGDATDIASGTTDFIVNTWQHLAVTYDGTTIRFYRNGAQVASSAFAPTITGGSVQMRLGFDAPNASYYNARMSGAYWAPSQVLTAAQVLSLYQNTFVPISNSAGFFWKLDEPNSALQHDSSGNGNHGTITNWATGVHYEGSDVPYSWQDEVGFSENNGSNLITGGTDLSNAAWVNTNSSETVNQEYSPVTGTLTADKLVENSAAATAHYIYNHTSKTATAKPYVLQFYAKAAGRTKVAARLANSGGSPRAEGLFTFSGDGTVTISTSGSGFSGVNADITNVGGGWYKCRVASVSDTDTYISSQFWLADSGGSTSYNGDGTSGIYISDVTLVEGTLHTPRNEANTTQDVIGNSLQHTGECPARPYLIDSHCLTLNGSNQSIELGTGTLNTDGTQTMEVEFVAKRNNTTYGPVISNRRSTGNSDGWEAGYSGITAGDVFFCICNVAASTNALWVYYPLIDDQWHRVRWTYDGSGTAAGVALYIDGVRTAATTYSNNLSGAVNASTVVSSIGRRNGTGGAGYLNGSIAYIKTTIGSTVWEYTCAEGSGSNIYEVRGGTSHAITNAGTNWSVLQRVYHANITRGFRLSGGVKIPRLHGSETLACGGGALTNPAGDWNNDAETNVDATCGVSTSTAWAGKTVPTSYEYGDSLSGSSLQRRTPNSIREDRYRIPV